MSSEIAPGRLGRVEVFVGGHSQCVYPTHNFGISSSKLNQFEELILADTRIAKTNPDIRSVLLLGDFNLEPEGYKRHVIPRPTGSRECELGEGYQAPAASRRWHRILDSLVEISNGAPTHFYPPQSFLNKIDRVFSSIPLAR